MYYEGRYAFSVHVCEYVGVCDLEHSPVQMDVILRAGAPIYLCPVVYGCAGVPRSVHTLGICSAWPNSSQCSTRKTRGALRLKGASLRGQSSAPSSPETLQKTGFESGQEIDMFVI